MGGNMVASEIEAAESFPSQIELFVVTECRNFRSPMQDIAIFIAQIALSLLKISRLVVKRPG
jgi:hypothetical protein